MKLLQDCCSVDVVLLMDQFFLIRKVLGVKIFHGHARILGAELDDVLFWSLGFIIGEIIRLTDINFDCRGWKDLEIFLGNLLVGQRF